VFERFSPAARALVVQSVAEAEDRESPTIGVTHVLRALASDSSPVTSGVLAEVGLPPAVVEEVLAEAERADRRGGVGSQDAAALRSLGIDVDAVVAEVEREHGAGALVPPVRRRRGLLRGHRPFTDAAKRVLELTLREAVDRGEREIRPEHVLLGLLAGTDPVSQELAGRGITRQTVRAALRRATEGGQPGSA
jgi:ATP-dependent Clp protease ATP-binding subunit ClpA